MKTYGYLHHRQFPYFKVEQWDPIALCWRITKRRYQSEADARSAFATGQTCRVVTVEEPKHA